MSKRRPISIILFPFTIWYAAGVAVRNMLFGLGIKKSESPKVTTISVGNLCVGGSGKSPMVEYLMELLSNEFSTALVSRGYRRKTKGLVVADSQSTADQIGDEPYMMHRKYPHVATVVCERRLDAVHSLLSDANPPQLIVLDDAYQHRYIKPSINILLTEYQHPYYNDHILPYGNLREFKSARDRANIIIVTKAPAKINPIEKHNILTSLKTQAYQKVFFSTIQYGQLTPLWGGETIDYPAQTLLVTGIAHPKPMLEEVGRHTKVTHMRYADHYDFTDGDLTDIRNAFSQLPQGSIILTTEKDAARLRQHQDRLSDLPIYYLPIKVMIQPNGDIEFDQVILKQVRENTKFLEKLSTNPISERAKTSPLMK